MARNVGFDQDEAIAKATQVFWQKGYNATSMRDLTDAMGINSSSLYNTIGDKHELFVLCLRHYTQNRRMMLENKAKAFQSPLAAITHYIEAVVDSVVEGASGCLAIKTAFEVSPHDETIKAILKADNDFTQAFLTTLLKKAIQQDEISNATDPVLMAEYIISTYTGWYELFILYKDRERIVRLAQFMVRQLVQ